MLYRTASVPYREYERQIDGVMKRGKVGRGGRVRGRSEERNQCNLLYLVLLLSATNAPYTTLYWPIFMFSPHLCSTCNSGQMY